MRNLSLFLVALTLLAGLAGCGKSPDEEAAYRDLAPKPPSEEQKKQVDAIKKKFGDGGPKAAHAGM